MTAARATVWTAGLIAGLIALAVPVAFGQEYDIDAVDARQEFEWGVRSYHNGFYNEAGLSFARVVARQSDSVLARLWLAKSYYAAGLQNAALEQYRILAGDGGASPYVRNRVETITSIQSGDLFLLPEPQYTVAEQINGHNGNRLLFSRPAGIAVDRDINLYISSFASHEVLQLSANGELQRNIWRNNYTFDRPYSVLVDDRSILVSEFGKDRVVRFSRDGAQEIRFNRAGIHGRLAGPQYLAVDEADNIYVSDWGNRRIVKFNSLGNFIYRFSARDIPGRPPFSPTGIVYHNEFLYIANSADGTLVVSDQNGNYVRTIELRGNLRIEGLGLFDAGRLLLAAKEGIFTYNLFTELLTQIATTSEDVVTSVAIDGNGTIYATDFNKNRILVLSPVDQIYGGLVVHTLSVDGSAFPRVTADVRVTNRFGMPMLGLRADNFSVREDTIVNRSATLYDRSDEAPLAIMVVVPLTERTERVAPQLRSFVTELLETLGDDDRVGVVFSGAEAVRQAELGTPFVRIRNHISEALRAAAQAADGRGPTIAIGEQAFGGALQLASSELLDDTARRAIIYIRDGGEIEAPFSRADRRQLANSLNINGISLIEVALDEYRPHESVTQFYTIIDARRFAYADSDAVGAVTDTLRTVSDGRYRLSYISDADDDFGRRYIPLSVEAFLYQRSGRDEAGYYSR